MSDPGGFGDEGGCTPSRNSGAGTRKGKHLSVNILVLIFINTDLSSNPRALRRLQTASRAHTLLVPLGLPIGIDSLFEGIDLLQPLSLVPISCPLCVLVSGSITLSRTLSRISHTLSHTSRTF